MGIAIYLVVGLFIVLGIVLVIPKRTRIAGKILLTFDSIVFLIAFSLFAALIIAFAALEHSYFYTIVFLISAVFVIAMVVCLIWGALKKKYVYMPIICGFIICVLTAGGYALYQGYIDSIPTVGESKDLLLSYTPYGKESKVALLDGEAIVKIDTDIPKMDGATALYPIYSAFARAIYPQEMLYSSDMQVVKDNEYLQCTTTTQAYENIVTGEADIIFVAAPSEGQKQFAERKGVKLEYTPIGKEAFVFFVNANNPIENIGAEQLRQIYSGEITQWSELGIDNMGSIRAFQRDEGSGSQSAIKRFMKDTELMAPPKENVSGGMGDIISRTADYRNFKNAIGYSFRFYSTQMVKNNQIKLLSIDGIYPDIASIENGTYPITSNFYAVTRSDKSENTSRLLEWILGTQGQELIEKTGYTPISK